MYPSFMDEDVVDTADTLDSSFFSKASTVPPLLLDLGGPSAPRGAEQRSDWDSGSLGSPVCPTSFALSMVRGWSLTQMGFGLYLELRVPRAPGVCALAPPQEQGHQWVLCPALRGLSDNRW